MRVESSILLRSSHAPGFEAALRRLGRAYDCRVVTSLEEIRDILERESIPVLIAWNHPSAGADVLEECRALHIGHPELKILLMAEAADRDPVIEAFNHGDLFRCLLETASSEALDEAVLAAVRRFEMERVEHLLLRNGAAIDRQIHSTPYWLYRLRTSSSAYFRALVGSAGGCFVTLLIVLLAGIGGFLLLYYVKSALGIDLFEDVHLRDFLP